MDFEIEGGGDLSEIDPAGTSGFLFLKRENNGIFIYHCRIEIPCRLPTVNRTNGVTSRTLLSELV